MQKLTHLYKNKMDFKHYVDSIKLNKNQQCLVKIYTLNIEEVKSVEVARTVKTIMPNALIVGASSIAGAVLDNSSLEEGILIIIEQFEKSSILIEFINYSNVSPENLALNFVEKFKFRASKSMIHAFFSDGYLETERFLDAVNNNPHKLKLSGGILGSNLREDKSGFIFDESGVYKNTLLAFSIINDKSYDTINILTSQDVRDKEYTITKMSGTYIEEIEGVPATEWFYDYLEIFDLKMSMTKWLKVATSEFLCYFPIVIGEKTSRCLFYDEKARKISTYYSKLENGTKFKVAYVDPEKTKKESVEICKNISKVPCENITLYSCIIRHIYMKKSLQWELAPFAKASINGIHTVGEFAYIDGENCLCNGNCVLIGFAESEVYMSLDKDVLDNRDSHNDFDATYYDKINSSLNLDAVVKNDKGEMVHLDEQLNIPNIYQFDKDKVSKKFNKVCLIEMNSADATIAFAGLEVYYATCKDFIRDTKSAISEQILDTKIDVYALNYKILVLAASEEISEDFFIYFIKKLSEDYEFATSEKTGVSLVVRFAVVLNQVEMIEVGMNVLMVSQDSQENFITCHNDTRNNKEANDELKIIDLIKRAIDNDGIVPYFQGIHNNEIGAIDKYESLMRIIDVDGKPYTPFAFMDIAKKYKFYNKLSQILIGKALDSFEDRDESVSLNVSLYDVMSSNFRNWLFNRLKVHKKPGNVVIEFVETEEYNDMSVLLDFLESIKKFGCKIAIDDFGSGYSTLTTVVKLKPDFLKIDGSIIKNLVTSEDSLILLDTIVYMAKKMGTQTIAEFVEDEDIQRILCGRGITYSQGYYFSKPEPIDSIVDNIKI